MGSWIRDKQLWRAACSMEKAMCTRRRGGRELERAKEGVENITWPIQDIEGDKECEIKGVFFKKKQ